MIYVRNETGEADGMAFEGKRLIFDNGIYNVMTNGRVIIVLMSLKDIITSDKEFVKGEYLFSKHIFVQSQLSFRGFSSINK